MAIHAREAHVHGRGECLLSGVIPLIVEQNRHDLVVTVVTELSARTPLHRELVVGIAAVVGHRGDELIPAWVEINRGEARRLRRVCAQHAQPHNTTVPARPSVSKLSDHD